MQESDETGGSRREIMGRLLSALLVLGVAGCVAPRSIHEAARTGKVRHVRAFLDSGVDANVKNEYAATPLHCADNSDVAALLLARGASPDSVGDLRRTPLHSAAIRGKPDVIRILLAKGGNVMARDVNGCTPLHEAARSGNASI